MKIIYVTQAHPSKNMPTGLLILICKIKIGKGNIIKFPLFILSWHSIYFQVGGDNPKVEGQAFF
jgi:hypothetical protein